VSTSIKAELRDLLKKASGTAGETCTETVIRFALKSEVTPGRRATICWSTYKAICSRMGLFKSNGVGATQPIDWNEQLAEKLTGLMVPTWNKIFNNELLRLHETHAASTRLIIIEFTRRLMQALEAVEPRISGPLRFIEPNCHRLDGEIKHSTKTILISLHDAAKGIHRKVKPLISKTMEPAYMHCKTESGKLPNSY